MFVELAVIPVHAAILDQNLLAGEGVKPTVMASGLWICPSPNTPAAILETGASAHPPAPDFRAYAVRLPHVEFPPASIAGRRAFILAGVKPITGRLPVLKIISPAARRVGPDTRHQDHAK